MSDDLKARIREGLLDVCDQRKISYEDASPAMFVNADDAAAACARAIEATEVATREGKNSYEIDAAALAALRRTAP